MSQEWGGPVPAMQTPITEERESPPDPRDNDFELTQDEEFYRKFFLACEANRSLLTDIRVVVPVRPQDGINVRLAQMLSIWHGEGVAWNPLNDHMGGFIECTRSNIAWHFKQQKEKYLLMIDNDMEPTIWLPLLLARHGQSVVGGCAMAVLPEHGPSLCFSVEDEEGNYRFPAMRYVKAIPSVGLKEVGHVGTGALCIRRDVIESFSFEGDDIPFMVPEAARKRGMSRGFLEVGEDISFCNQVRAKGFKMYVDLEAHVGHRKTVSLRWDEDLRDPALDAKRWRLPCKGKVLHTR